MKKLICLAIAAIISLSLISCDTEKPPETIDPGLHQNPDGGIETPIVPIG